MTTSKFLFIKKFLNKIKNSFSREIKFYVHVISFVCSKLVISCGVKFKWLSYEDSSTVVVYFYIRQWVCLNFILT